MSVGRWQFSWKRDGGERGERKRPSTNGNKRSSVTKRIKTKKKYVYSVFGPAPSPLFLFLFLWVCIAARINSVRSVESGQCNFAFQLVHSACIADTQPNRISHLITRPWRKWGPRAFNFFRNRERTYTPSGRRERDGRSFACTLRENSSMSIKPIERKSFHDRASFSNMIRRTWFEIQYKVGFHPLISADLDKEVARQPYTLAHVWCRRRCVLFSSARATPFQTCLLSLSYK